MIPRSKYFTIPFQLPTLGEFWYNHNLLCFESLPTETHHVRRRHNDYSRVLISCASYRIDKHATRCVGRFSETAICFVPRTSAIVHFSLSPQAERYQIVRTVLIFSIRLHSVRNYINFQLVQVLFGFSAVAV